MQVLSLLTPVSKWSSAKFVGDGPSSVNMQASVELCELRLR